jgi:hypothetical protein
MESHTNDGKVASDVMKPTIVRNFLSSETVLWHFVDENTQHVDLLSTETDDSMAQARLKMIRVRLEFERATAAVFENLGNKDGKLHPVAPTGVCFSPESTSK